MTTLHFVKPSPSPTLNVLMYGPAKTGKTVGACTAPGNLLLLNADRPTSSRFAHHLHGERVHEVQVKGLNDLIEVNKTIKADPDHFDSVVLDTIGDTHRVLLEELSQGKLHASLPNYGDANTHLERFCRAMCDFPVNFVMVAHDLRARNEETGGFESLPNTGTSNPAMGAKLMAMADVFGYTGVERDEDTKTDRYLIQLYDDRGRRGGSRFRDQLGSVRAIDIAEWLDTIKASEKPKAAKAA